MAVVLGKKGRGFLFLRETLLIFFFLLAERMHSVEELVDSTAMPFFVVVVHHISTWLAGAAADRRKSQALQKTSMETDKKSQLLKCPKETITYLSQDFPFQYARKSPSQPHQKPP